MIPPELPADEDLRLSSLRSLRVLDTPPEERFDRFTRLARRLFDVPIALVSLVDEDRQWFKARSGLDAGQTPRDVSFCGHAILGDEVFVVPDARSDARFHDNPLVGGTPEIRFYAGYPISAPCGRKVGTLCIIDRQPRELDSEQTTLLEDLGRMVEDELAALSLATVDALTGLSNRRGFLAVATRSLHRCRSTGRPATLLYLDLDGFKQINDRFGHGVGDRALRDFSDLLLGCFRDSDVVGRLGGDEFVVLLGGARPETAERAAERLQAALEAHNLGAGRRYELRCSAGFVAFDPDRHRRVLDLLEDADRRMYEQKADRRRLAAGAAL